MAIYKGNLVLQCERGEKVRPQWMLETSGEAGPTGLISISSAIFRLGQKKRKRKKGDVSPHFSDIDFY